MTEKYELCVNTETKNLELIAGFVTSIAGELELDDDVSFALQMAVDGDLKLIRALASGRSWLYNLTTDPKELTDLSEEEPAHTHRLNAQLDSWADSFPSLFSESDVALEGNEEKILQLRALGYLD